MRLQVWFLGSGQINGVIVHWKESRALRDYSSEVLRASPAHINWTENAYGWN
jgi:hypothetical protein